MPAKTPIPAPPAPLVDPRRFRLMALVDLDEEPAAAHPQPDLEFLVANLLDEELEETALPRAA